MPPRTLRQCSGTTQKGSRCRRTKMASSQDAHRYWSCWQHSSAKPDALYMRCNGIAVSTKSRCKLKRGTTSEKDALRGYYCHHHVSQEPAERIKPESEADPTASEARYNGIRPATDKLQCMNSKGIPSKEDVAVRGRCGHHHLTSQEASVVRGPGITTLKSAVRPVNNTTEGRGHRALQAAG